MMRNARKLLALSLLLVVSAGGLAMAQPEGLATFHGFPAVAVVVDGEDLGVSGIVIDGVTYAPARALAQALGQGVGWHPDTMTVTIGSGEPASAKAPGDGTAVGGAMTEATPEEIAAARAAYDAAVAQAQETYQADINDIYYRYGPAGLHSSCSHWNAYLTTCEQAYYDYSTPHGSGAFVGEDYDSYLAVCEAARAERVAGCAAAGCPDPDVLRQQELAAAETEYQQALTDAHDAYVAATGLEP